MENKNKQALFISSGLSGGISTSLVKNTKSLLENSFNILSVQFASDPDYEDNNLKDYSKITLEEIYLAFDKVIADTKPSVCVGHSFSALLILYYLLERPNLIKNTKKIILLDPSNAKDIHSYLFSNTDGFILDKSIVERLGPDDNLRLIQSIKDEGIEIVQVEADNYELDHEFGDLGKLTKVYKDLSLL